MNEKHHPTGQDNELLQLLLLAQMVSIDLRQPPAQCWRKVGVCWISAVRDKQSCEHARLRHAGGHGVPRALQVRLDGGNAGDLLVEGHQIRVLCRQYKGRTKSQPASSAGWQAINEHPIHL